MVNMNEAVGMAGVITGINAEIAKIGLVEKRNMAKAMIFLKGKVLPVTPESGHNQGQGNLRGSCYTRVYDTPAGPVGEIGFTAEYAIYVHEMGIDPPKVINWTTAGTGNKFLERPMKENANSLVKIIAGGTP